MNYIKELQKFGLKDNEARVYLAGLELGPTKISALARKTGLKRTNVYALVEKLMEMGLFKTKTTGLKKYYSAESPDNLKTLVEKQTEETINTLKSKVEKQENSETNEILRFKGVAGMKAAFQSMLENRRSGEFYYVISDGNQWYDTDPGYFEKFLKKRARYNLNLKLILVDNEYGRHSLKYQKNYNEEVKLLPKENQLNVNFAFTPDKVLIHEYSNPRLTTIMKSPKVSLAMKQMFDLVWKNLK